MNSENKQIVYREKNSLWISINCSKCNFPIFLGCIETRTGIFDLMKTLERVDESAYCWLSSSQEARNAYSLTLQSIEYFVAILFSLFNVMAA